MRSAWASVSARHQLGPVISPNVSAIQSAMKWRPYVMLSTLTCSTPPVRSSKIFSSRLGLLTSWSYVWCAYSSGDLPVVLTVGDEERHRHLIEQTVEGDARAQGEELVQVAGAPHPAHVLPVVGDRTLALVLEPTPLHLTPVVIRAPHRPERETGLGDERPRRVVAAQRDAADTDPLGVDIGA